MPSKLVLYTSVIRGEASTMVIGLGYYGTSLRILFVAPRFQDTANDDDQSI